MNFLWQTMAKRLSDLAQLLGPKHWNVLILDADLPVAQTWWQDQLQQPCVGIEVRDLHDLDQLPSKAFDLIIWTLPPIKLLDPKIAPAIWLKLRLCCKGFMLFATPGPKTIPMLNQIFSVNLPPLARDLHDIGDDLVRAGWQRPMLQEQHVSIAYNHYETLFEDWCVLGREGSHPLWLNAPKSKALATKPNEPVNLDLTLGLVYNGQDHTIQQQLDDGSIAIPVTALKKKT